MSAKNRCSKRSDRSRGLLAIGELPSGRSFDTYARHSDVRELRDAMLLALSGLIAAAFLAATPIPMQSEAVFVAMQIAGAVPVGAMILAAGAANTAGSVVTWAMGRGLGHLGRQNARTAAQLARAERLYARWGRWTLLLSWAPLGDAICLAAGAMQVPLWQFTPIVALAKTARYAVLAAATAGFVNWGWA